MGTGAARIDSQASAAAEASVSHALAELLRRPRFEVLPLDGIEDEVRAHVPAGARVTITASPRKGLDATVALSERLAGAGCRIVPHISARLVRDRAHLEELLARLRDAGVRELFVPAGDTSAAAGEFAGAAELLEAMGPLRAGFEDVGITGYPESHHLIPDDETIRAMFTKAPMATCIISQICFDADAIGAWIRAVRERGTALPIWVGMPGAVDHAKLLRISMKIGLGESVRFLGHQHGWVSRLITRRFKPDRLLRDLTPVVVDPPARVMGFHLYTFNEVARTERWRQQTLARVEGG